MMSDVSFASKEKQIVDKNDDESSKNVLENEDAVEEESSGEEEEEQESVQESNQRARHALTCRKVTLNTLMNDGVIEAGKGVLSIDYLGQRFEADLLDTGKIKWHGSQEEFGTPSAWAMYCKRLVNTNNMKRSGCGWASVKYKGKKLDIWKSIWARKLRTTPFKSPYTSASSRTLSPSAATTTTTTSSSSSSSSATAKPTESPLVSAENKTMISPLSTTVGLDWNKPTTTTSTTTSFSNVNTADSAISGSEKSSAISENSIPTSSSPSSLSSLFPSSMLSSLPSSSSSSSSSSLSTQSLSALLSPSLQNGNSAASSSVFLSTLTAAASGGGGSGSAPAVIGQDFVKENTNVLPCNKQDLVINTTATTQQIPSLQPTSLQPAGCKRPSPSPNQPIKELMPSLGQTRMTHTDIVLRDRKQMRYSDLDMRTADIDMNTLVQCEGFTMHKKLQPFSVLVATNAMLVMDFHCHLTRSEVAGYLGGRWDPVQQTLTIVQAFPVLCRFADQLHGPVVEDEIRRRMRSRKMVVVGWYHSHPYCQPLPSIRDVDCQMSYQLQMRGVGSTYHPCIGFIQAPFTKQENNLQAFWVMPNLENPSSLNIPMNMSYSVQRDLSLTEDVLIDMKMLSEFYSGSPDRVRFKEKWKDDVSYLEKVRGSLASKLPEDQLICGTFLDYMQQLLRDMK